MVSEPLPPVKRQLVWRLGARLAAASPLSSHGGRTSPFAHRVVHVVQAPKSRCCCGGADGLDTVREALGGEQALWLLAVEDRSQVPHALAAWAGEHVEPEAVLHQLAEGRVLGAGVVEVELELSKLDGRPR
jgi:hypothetical protein